MLKEISIEIIRKCPNKCVHCSSFSSVSCQEMISFRRFKEVIDSASSIGLQKVCFSGGEPFLHSDIEKMISYVHSLGLESYIYTSGIILDKNNERISISADTLKRINGNVSKLIFNVEASNEKTYDCIMGTKGCFELMLQSIKEAVSYGIMVEAHFVPMKLNINQIESTLQLCAKLGVSKVSFLRLVVHGRAAINQERIELSDQELVEVENTLHLIHEQNKYPIRIGVPLLGETQENHCEAAKGKLNIRYDGKVFPCEVFKNNRVGILENIQPESIYDQNLANIYNDSMYLNRVRELLQQFSYSNNCENCIGQYYMKTSKEE